MAAHMLQLPVIRYWLIEVARQRGIVTIRDIAEVFGVGRQGASFARSALAKQSKELGEPFLSALIVHARTKRNTEVVLWGADNDETERERVYEYWKDRVDKQSEFVSEDIQVKASRFATVEVRPDQAAFRRRVFLKYGGKCAISDCTIEKVLDAAHKQGGIWREGHNHADDGVLLRRDLHALYDNGLLWIAEDGAVTLAPSAAEHYMQFASVTVAL